MSVPDTLSELGRKLGIEDLVFQDNDTCQLIVGEGLVVTIELIRGEEAVYLYSDICPKPAPSDTAIYVRLLEANLFAAETGGGTLALNASTDTVVLWEKVDLTGRGADDLHAELQEFASWLLTWQGELSGDIEHNSGSDNASTDAAATAFLRV